MFKNDSVSHRFLDVAVAFHSYQVESIQKEFLEKIGRIETEKPKFKIYSTVDDNLKMDEKYWYENMRRPVRKKSNIY